MSNLQVANDEIPEQKVKKIRSELQGFLEISCRGQKSHVVNIYSTYPLKIMEQEPWNPYVTASLLGYGGGMISGDSVHFNIVINEGANAW